jgi:hypothetical protein
MTTRSILVAASYDDCMVQWTGAVWGIYPTLPYLDTGINVGTSDKRGNGMRFRNVLIPKGATINTSYITFTCSSANAEVVVKSRLCDTCSIRRA